MTDKTKQGLVIAVGVLVIGAVVWIQIRRARPAPPVVLPPPTEASSSPGPDAAPLDAADGNGLQTGDIAPARISTPSPMALPAARTDGDWGRNPFMTPAEEAALRFVPDPIILELPAPEPPPEPGLPDLPAYTVTAIANGPGGFSAIVNNRVIREGDVLGAETVREINARGIVLEFNGQLREVAISRPGLGPASPGGD